MCLYLNRRRAIRSETDRILVASIPSLDRLAALSQNQDSGLTIPSGFAYPSHDVAVVIGKDEV